MNFRGRMSPSKPFAPLALTFLCSIAGCATAAAPTRLRPDHTPDYTPDYTPLSIATLSGRAAVLAAAEQQLIDLGAQTLQTDSNQVRAVFSDRGPLRDVVVVQAETDHVVID